MKKVAKNKQEEKKALERYLEKLEHIQQFNQVNLNESESDKKKRIQRAKEDYAFFVDYYFPHYAKCECADFQIEAAEFIKDNPECIDAEIWARAHAKSTHLDVMLPFWLWMNDEIDVMLLVGKSEVDAKTLLSDLQAEFEVNPQILADFGVQKSLGKWEEGNFVTKNDVAFFSLGRGQSPRGVKYKNKRPNIIVVDDIDDDEIVENPRRVKKVFKWLFGALYNTMDDNGARLIFGNNLISNVGIIAHVIEKIKALSKHNKTARVNFVNALKDDGTPSWPAKYTREHFDRRLEVIGTYAFQTELMNNPQIEGKIFKDEEIQWCPIPNLKDFTFLIGTWDVAYSGSLSSDFNAVKIWGLHNGKYYLIKAFVRQCKMKQAIQFMVSYDKALPKGIYIHWCYESQFWNDALKMTYDEVMEEEDYNLHLVEMERPTENKYQRIIKTQPYYQGRKIYYNEEEKHNTDMQMGINQLKSIEPGYSTHDDSPDADEMAITYLSKFQPKTNPMPLLGSRSSGIGAW